jgi:hypothetical protein
VGEIITRWITAKVILLPREDGRPQQPPRIFAGYRNSNLYLERPDGGGYELPCGGAAFFPVDREQVEVGETGLVHLYAWVEAAIELHPGRRFVFTDWGRRVVLGMITALLPAAPVSAAVDRGRIIGDQ